MREVYEYHIPRGSEEIDNLHEAAAFEAQHSVGRFFDACSVMLGQAAADRSRAALLPDGLDGTDFVSATQALRDAAEYAGQGIAPGERPGAAPTLADRERRVRALHAAGEQALLATTVLMEGYEYLWEGVNARHAIDFGGRVSLEGLRLLSNLSKPVLRNAVSMGALKPGDDGMVPAGDALDWLLRRREFCPSRWRNLADDQWPFDPEKVREPDAHGTIIVPQAADGSAFVPDLVARPARPGPGLSITVGAKGEEVQQRDFFAALAALAAMRVPHWRRRNSAGNWGVVRARGPWVSVSKAEIERQLAAKTVKEPK